MLACVVLKQQVKEPGLATLAAGDSMSLERCPWPSNDPLMIEYHDKEWGVPLHDDRRLFEFMVLDAFQAGLSWRTILYKRENLRKAFAGFDFEKVAGYDQEEVERLLTDSGIIRNRLKVQSAIANARQILRIRQEMGSFDRYIWALAGGKTAQNAFRTVAEVPSRTATSDAMSRELKKQGFQFVGSTICYAFMQAAGMVNDHLVTCFRYAQLRGS